MGSPLSPKWTSCRRVRCSRATRRAIGPAAAQGGIPPSAPRRRSPWGVNRYAPRTPPKSRRLSRWRPRWVGSTPLGHAPSAHRPMRSGSQASTWTSARLSASQVWSAAFRASATAARRSRTPASNAASSVARSHANTAKATPSTSAPRAAHVHLDRNMGSFPVEAKRFQRVTPRAPRGRLRKITHRYRRIAHPAPARRAPVVRPPAARSRGPPPPAPGPEQVSFPSEPDQAAAGVRYT